MTSIPIEMVQGLPPELFNKICSSVMNDEEDEPTARYRHITNHFEFPKGLHISAESRRASIQKYFTNVIFLFTSTDVLCKFAATLSHTNIPTIRLIMVHLNLSKAAIESMHMKLHFSLREGREIVHGGLRPLSRVVDSAELLSAVGMDDEVHHSISLFQIHREKQVGQRRSRTA